VSDALPNGIGSRLAHEIGVSAPLMKIRKADAEKPKLRRVQPYVASLVNVVCAVRRRAHPLPRVGRVSHSLVKSRLGISPRPAVTRPRRYLGNAGKADRSSVLCVVPVLLTSPAPVVDLIRGALTADCTSETKCH
jgi:hypothetical protein